MHTESHGLIPAEQAAPALLPEQVFLRGQVVTAGGAVVPRTRASGSLGLGGEDARPPRSGYQVRMQGLGAVQGKASLPLLPADVSPGRCNGDGTPEVLHGSPLGAAACSWDLAYHCFARCRGCVAFPGWAVAQQGARKLLPVLFIHCSTLGKCQGRIW